MLTNCLAACVHLTIHVSVSEIERDICEKHRHFFIPSCIRRPRYGGCRRNVGIPFGKEKLEWCRYPTVKKFLYVYSFCHDPWTWRTDGQRDTASLKDRAYAYTSRSKNQTLTTAVGTSENWAIAASIRQPAVARKFKHAVHCKVNDDDLVQVPAGITTTVVVAYCHHLYLTDRRTVYNKVVLPVQHIIIFYLPWKMWRHAAISRVWRIQNKKHRCRRQAVWCCTTVKHLEVHICGHLQKSLKNVASHLRKTKTSHVWLNIVTIVAWSVHDLPAH